MAEQSATPVRNYSGSNWMVRPCELYREEYRDCKSFRSRFHQEFTTGQRKDCSQWKQDYVDCVEWEKTVDQAALARIVSSEKQRIAERVTNVMKNDVWHLRSAPREDWNDPLPEHLARMDAGEIFKKAQPTTQKSAASSTKITSDLPEDLLDQLVPPKSGVR